MLKEKLHVNSLKEGLYDQLLNNLTGERGDEKIGFLVFNEPTTEQGVEERASRWKRDNPKGEVLYILCFSGLKE